MDAIRTQIMFVNIKPTTARPNHSSVLLIVNRAIIVNMADTIDGYIIV